MIQGEGSIRYRMMMGNCTWVLIPTEEAFKLGSRSRIWILWKLPPTAKPPVCRIMDYGKHKYKASKKAHEAKKKQKIIHLKEVKFRPNTDQHDFDFKLRTCAPFSGKWRQGQSGDFL